MVKGFTFPTYDFILDSSFVFLAVRSPSQKVSRSYVIRTLSPEIFNFKDVNYWLTQFPLPYLEEADSLAYAINRHLR